jgi:hypothetical protein
MGHLAGTGNFEWPTLVSALLGGTVIASFAVEAFSVDGICRLEKASIDSRRAELEDLIGHR